MLLYLIVGVLGLERRRPGLEKDHPGIEEGLVGATLMIYLEDSGSE